MKCPAAQELIEPYIDGELDATQRAEVRAHLESCISCAETHWQVMELRTNLKKEAPYFQAPDRLRERISAGTRQEAGRGQRRPDVLWKWMAFAASLLLTASTGWNIEMLRSGPSAPDRIESEVLSSHLRSLTGDHLLDVASTDRHTVKPWFAGKLDFSPVVKDLASHGYPLIGGRIEYINEKPVAVLVYRRAKHVINVFTWPASDSPLREQFQRRGYNLLEWSGAGMTNWAVSDLNNSDLTVFVQMLSADVQ